VPHTHGQPCVSEVGTVRVHGHASNRAQLLTSRHGRTYPATDRAPPDDSPGLRRRFIHVRNWSQSVIFGKTSRKLPLSRP